MYELKKMADVVAESQLVYAKGACKYYISPLGVGGGSEGNASFAYVKNQNSYSPEKWLLSL